MHQQAEQDVQEQCTPTRGHLWAEAGVSAGHHQVRPKWMGGWEGITHTPMQTKPRLHTMTELGLHTGPEASLNRHRSMSMAALPLCKHLLGFRKQTALLTGTATLAGRSVEPPTMPFSSLSSLLSLPPASEPPTGSPDAPAPGSRAGSRAPCPIRCSPLMRCLQALFFLLSCLGALMGDKVPSPLSSPIFSLAWPLIPAKQTLQSPRNQQTPGASGTLPAPPSPAWSYLQESGGTGGTGDNTTAARQTPGSVYRRLHARGTLPVQNRDPSLVGTCRTSRFQQRRGSPAASRERAPLV